MYIICEKTYIDRLGKQIDDETNIGNSESVEGLIKKLEQYSNLKIAKRTIYNAIKTEKPIYDKYYIYKIKEKVHNEE